MPKFHVLTVRLHGDVIGTLTLLPDERILFSFDQSYIDNSARPTFSLSVKSVVGELITEIKPTRVQLPPVFSNLLPEGHLREYLAARSGVKPQREFFLLQALGHDLPGAMTVSAATEDHQPSDSPSDADEAQPAALRFSLAGVQLKFCAVLAARGGLTIPARGVGGSWILKLPSTRFPGVPENEYSMMTLARQIGMDIPEIRLVALSKIANLPHDIERVSGKALAVRRFDRTDDGPVHMEDFAQVFGIYPRDKYHKGSYKNIAEVLWQETGATGITEFIRRLVFNTLIGNADLHLKNFSLLFPDRRRAQLAPGYDFVSTISYLADEQLALTLGRSKRMAELSLAQLAYLAAKAGLPETLVLDTARDTVQRFRQTWKNERKHLPISSTTVRTIDKHMKTIRLVDEV